MKRYRMIFEDSKSDSSYIVHVSARDFSNAYDKVLTFLFEAYGGIIWSYYCSESEVIKSKELI